VRRGRGGRLIAATGPARRRARAISGLLPLPPRGRIEFEGERIDGRASAQVVARGIAHVPEGRQLFAEHERAREPRAGPRGPPRVRATLETVFACFRRLRERERQVAGYSLGGEQQMCAIAAASCPPEAAFLARRSRASGLAPVM